MELFLLQHYFRRFHDVSVIDNGSAYKVCEHLTDFWTKKAMDFIDKAERQSKDRLFFLYLSYNGPYNLPPVVLSEARNRFASYYRNNPPSQPQESVHPFAQQWAIEASVLTDREEPMKNYRLIGDEQKKSAQERWLELAWGGIQALNNKQAMIKAASETAMVDDGVGKVLAMLASRGLDENTIVIFTSDQGASYGQHGLWGNASWASPVAAYDEHMNVPFIVRHTNHIPSGKITDAPINQFDVFPTVLDYLSMSDKVIENSPGKSFLGVLQNTSPKWENDIFYDYILTRAVQTKEFKYVKRFMVEPNELYDLRSDPEEKINLIDEPKYANTIQALDGKIEAFFSRHSDPRFNVWKGGTAKSVLMYGHANGIFESTFDNWRGPFVESVKPFKDQ